MIKTPRRAPPRPYHHGNLVAAIVEAALALLDETQDWTFSLREVARRAGVSHNAPYKHFPEKRDLLAAVAARGFDMLTERTLSLLDGVTDARVRLLLCGRAFITLGMSHPALYRLMFGPALSSARSGRPMIEKIAAAKARSVVDAAIVEAARTGVFPSSLAGPRESAAAALAMWSMMHGLTMLTIDDFAGPPEAIEAVVDSMLGTLLDGIASNPPKLAANVWLAPRLEEKARRMG